MPIEPEKFWLLLVRGIFTLDSFVIAPTKMQNDQSFLLGLDLQWPG